MHTSFGWFNDVISSANFWTAISGFGGAILGGVVSYIFQNHAEKEKSREQNLVSLFKGLKEEVKELSYQSINGTSYKGLHALEMFCIDFDKSSVFATSNNSNVLDSIYGMVSYSYMIVKSLEAYPRKDKRRMDFKFYSDQFVILFAAKVSKAANTVFPKMADDFDKKRMEQEMQYIRTHIEKYNLEYYKELIRDSSEVEGKLKTSNSTSN